jgi:small subunit ribosomal protein S7
MRGKQAPIRKLQPDEIYNSETVSKLINYVMQDGKKAVARKTVYQALEELGKQTKSEPVSALQHAIDNVKPKIEVKARRVGGANYQVPVPVSGNRQLALTFRWIINTARDGRGNKPFWKSLATELAAAHKGEGNAIKKKQDVERQADANRAFSQFSF